MGLQVAYLEIAYAEHARVWIRWVKGVLNGVITIPAFDHSNSHIDLLLEALQHFQGFVGGAHEDLPDLLLCGFM
jgi:hypothetical protein